MMFKAGFKSNFNFKVETKGKMDIFGSELAIEASRWIKALKKAKKTHEETMRTKSQVLYRNVDGIIENYKKNKINELIRFFE
jgi:signal transduction histidine kinase